MSCCNPCDTSVTYENRRAEEQAAKTNKELQQKLENTLKELAELKAKHAEMTSHPCCPLFKVESITKAGSEVLITFDNCTFVKAPMSIVDNALMQGKSEENSNTVEALKQALEELKTKVQTLESKEDKDTVFDPSSLEARVTALEATKGTGSFDPSSLEARLSALFVRKADLVDIQNFEGNVMFRAFPTTEAPVEATAETEAQPVVPAPAGNKLQ